MTPSEATPPAKETHRMDAPNLLAPNFLHGAAGFICPAALRSKGECVHEVQSERDALRAQTIHLIEERDDWIDRYDKADDTADRLRAALKPFALAAGGWASVPDERAEDTFIASASPGSRSIPFAVSVAAMRTARRALDPEESL